MSQELDNRIKSNMVSALDPSHMGLNWLSSQLTDRLFSGYAWHTFHNKTQKKTFDIYISHN